MDQLEEYSETIEFRDYGGHKVIVPNDLDFALQQHMLNQQKEEQERLAAVTEPPSSVKAARATLKDTEATEAELELARAKVSAYDARSDAEMEAWRTAEWRTVRKLERMEEAINGDLKDIGDVSTKTFRMREFSRRQRRKADEEFTTFQEGPDGQQQKTIDTDPRNDRLLQECLLGEVVNGETVPVEDILDLQDTVAAILIDRMWARNTMSSELLGFFGKRQKPSL